MKRPIIKKDTLVYGTRPDTGQAMPGTVISIGSGKRLGEAKVEWENGGSAWVALDKLEYLRPKFAVSSQTTKRKGSSMLGTKIVVKADRLTADVDYSGGVYYITVFWGVSHVASVQHRSLAAAVNQITEDLTLKYRAMKGPIQKLIKAEDTVTTANRELYAVDENGRKFFDTLFPSDFQTEMVKRNRNLLAFYYSLHDIQRKLWDATE